MGCIHADGGSLSSACSHCQREELIGKKVRIETPSFGLPPQTVEIIEEWESNIMNHKFLAVNRFGEFVFLFHWAGEFSYSWLNINNLDEQKT